MGVTCCVFIAMSLDGYIARKDGDIDWLMPAEYSQKEDYGYLAFIDSIDAIVMGRKSFEKVCTFDAWPYGDIPVIVLSAREISIPSVLKSTVSSFSKSLDHLVDDLHSAGKKRLYIDGGITIQRFLAAERIDRMTITVIPVLLGEGIRLFGFLPKQVHLRLEGSRCFDSGYVQLQYTVIKAKV
ncbi:MAG: dihydrofolate reductase [Spirochaetales bacterium]|nr:dihydrofolate reductase [Spirochaetales bacterium]